MDNLIAVAPNQKSAQTQVKVVKIPDEIKFDWKFEDPVAPKVK